MSEHEPVRAQARALARELRPTLYHRLHALLPIVAHPLARKAWRLLGAILAEAASLPSHAGAIQ